MKTLSKNTKVASVFIICLGLTLIISGCNDDETPPDCGCNSETIYNIPNDDVQVPVEEQKTGLLFFKHPENIDGFYDDELYNNRFWIFQGTEGCHNCQRNFIICDENLIGAEYDYLKQQNINDSLQVKFTGNAKRLCLIKVIPADYDYKEIVLTSIELQ
ncbi:hypothetical protein VOI54_02955 [Tamlana sp. 2201CG12-4]|uniref:hypothetical protein n=1 Tax=Tamlana sp. 2201CG12-4 TaxID=3112582 RepID=UPI002DB77FA9|nr:hypothetical protein [Tamlana sp. 2201CG12-4]MEC3905969.1 hypothetical protein [Tamlana sp. 2201CG12-4]